MPKYEYEQKVNGSQIVVNIAGEGETKHFACCDCCLDHLFIFEPGPKKGQITITVYRDDARTTEMRKGKRVVLK